MENPSDLNRDKTIHVQNAFLFDVDGVITDPETKQLDLPEIADFLVEQIREKNPVAIVTGRALPWVEERVVPHILERIPESERKILDLFFVSGEFGGSYATWESGKLEHNIDSNIRLSEDLINKTKAELEKFYSSHFFDDQKQTMVSLEMKDGVDFKKFKSDQEKLAEKLRETVKSYPRHEEIEVHIDRIATNIRYKSLNKSYAADQVLKWVGEKNISPREFLTFGDSASDAEMSSRLAELGLKTKLVFVGGPEHLKGKKLSFPVKFTTAYCDEGLVEFIKEFSSQESRRPVS